MKIVMIEDFFHPDAGYQVNILAKYFVNFGHEVIILTAEMEKIPDELTSFFGKNNIEVADRSYEEKYGAKIIRIPIKKYYSGRCFFDKKIFKLVDELKPDILYVHGNDTYIGIQYIIKSKKIKYPIITDSHMLEMASKNKFNKLFRHCYKRFITPILIRNRIPVIRTQDDDYVERCLGIPLQQCPWVSYGSDVLLFHPDEDVKTEKRKQLNISEDDFVFVFAGKLIESKGAMLLANAFKNKFDTKKNVILLVVGNTNGEYGENVEKTFSKSENRIIRIPTQKYEQLAPYYQLADAAIFAKQCSLSFYDVQACALPVISENNNINVDRCSHNNGMCFIADDLNDMRSVITKMLNMPKELFDSYKQCSYQFIKDNYNYEQKAQEYMDIIKQKINAN
ncbi:MAG: glycosyltransferase family 4 protein [Spirochaetia bacterium]|nr:glycosyltransferase family 4 protein [Spirochaetia bacterium]